MKKIKRNRIQCKHCNDIIESFYTHDFKYCRCGKVASDGGLEYAQRSCPEGDYEEHIREMIEFEEN
jgi:hypothetical protein